MRLIGIILLTIAAAMVYGIIHDQITARICVEYFTIGHPPVFHTDNPTLLGLGWGVIATWWVGAILGVPLALSARAGSWPKFGPMRLARPLGATLLIIAAVAAIAGVCGHIAASRHWVYLDEPLNWMIEPEKQVAFITDLWTHLASYLAGAVGGIGLCIWVLVRRRRDWIVSKNTG